MTDPNIPVPEGDANQPPQQPVQPGQGYPQQGEPFQGQQPPSYPNQGQPQQGYPGQPQQGYPGQPQQGYPGGYQQQEAQPLSQAEDKQWAAFSHFGGILGPIPVLIIMLVFGKRGPWTNQESKESMNWQITLVGSIIVLAIVFGIISGILWTNVGTWGVAATFAWVSTLIYLVIWALNILFCVQGGMKVNNNGAYRYPFALRLIK